MAKIRSKNTSPEMIVRKILTKLGYKYRLYSNKLPGKPDIYIPKLNTAIFVNGCFWHHHTGCKRATSPKTNSNYWKNKLDKNINKQKEDIEKLTKLGKNAIIIWECQTRNQQNLYSIFRRVFNEKENI